MVFSRTITEPTYFRGQVDREATTVAMFMKYSSQETRGSHGLCLPEVSPFSADHLRCLAHPL